MNDHDINAIIISDFNEKIAFINKKPNFDEEMLIRITKSLNKNLVMNYIQEYTTKQYEFKIMDTLISSKIKVKISLLGEIIAITFYDASVDLNLMNLINQRMIEALYQIARTKKLKMEMLARRYNDTNLVLEDTLYMLDPKIRLNLKQGEMRMTNDMISV
jgi:hypothetical protein